MNSELKLMSGQKLRSNWDAPTYRIMLFKPIGLYPKGCLFTPNSFFSADEDLVFSVTYSCSWKALDEDIAYSEFDWASPEELRTLGAILLSEKIGDALVRFYPVTRYSPRIDSEYLDLSSRDTVSAVKELLIEKSNKPRPRSGDDVISECVGGKYQLVSPDRYNLDRLQIFWSKLSVSNYVLMRGITSLIKADMLSCYSEFWEEAIIVAYIALESSFHLVCRELKSKGVLEPTANNAARWLYENFDKPFGLPEPTIEKYFQEFYEDRIKVLHPSSRYGEAPFSPIIHDDYTHLRRSLREVFSYITAGEHGEDYYEEIERHARYSVSINDSNQA